MAKTAKGDKDEEVIFDLEPPEGREMLTPEQQVERNRLIVSMRIRRKPWHEIADKAKCSERWCRTVFEEYRKQNKTLRHNDPVEIVDELLDGYQAVLEDLESVAENADSDSAKVGALNSKMRAYREMGELLQAIGVLPHDLGTLRIEMDARVVADRVITILDRAGLPDEVFNEILEALGGAPPELIEAAAQS